MMATVRVPGIGDVDRRWVWAGVGVVALVVGGAWLLRLRRPSPDSPVYDPTTGDIASGGYVNPAPGGRSADGIIDQGASDVIDTNAEWADDVAQALSNMFEPSYVVVVLGKYLAGMPLTPEEADVARAAIAIRGLPPQGAPPITIVSKPEPEPEPDRDRDRDRRPRRRRRDDDDDDDEEPEPAPPAPPPPPPPPPPPKKTYTVKSGDTLSRIAALYGVRWMDIYNANASVIEAEARRRGYASSRGPDGSPGWWIFPGTVLTIP